MKREIYLDNSATTRPYDEVINFMSEINTSFYGNPSSLHTKGIEAEKLLKKARKEVANSLGADSKQLIFTSGGTESNNLAILGYLNANPRNGKHVITTMLEHPSVLEVYKSLAEKGYEVDYIKNDSSGTVDLNDLENKIRNDTALISCIYVNNETGAIAPLKDIVRIKNSRNPEACLHIDAVQAFGKIPIDPQKSGVGLMSVSSHKIHGPKGIGALFVSKGTKIKPIIYGGGQETGLRSGTENVPGICGFGMACSLTFKNIEANYQKTERLRSLLLDGIKSSGLDYKLVSPEGSLPYILNVAFNNIRSEVLLHHLEEKNIYVSSGSACSSRKKAHSHVLKAMGIEPCYMEGAIRFSFSAMNEEDEILETIEALRYIVPKINIKHGGTL
jgi:cysteine desulfurase